MDIHTYGFLINEVIIASFDKIHAKNTVTLLDWGTRYT